MNHSLMLCGVSVLAIALATSVQAQAVSGDPVTSDVGEIVVTGSRVVRDGFQAPTPVTVVGEQQLQEQAVTRLVDVSRNLPAFRNQGGARSGSNGSANGGQGSLNMRGLGANRNLILLDRRRVVPSTGNGIVDVNILPSALVQRIDVVTGGASAAWGSDAVSGVVNFVLDTQFEGLKAEVSAGVSQHGDNEEFSLMVAGGRAFANGRGRIILSADYFIGDDQPLMARDWLADRPGFINNPAFAAGNGEYRRIRVPGNIVSAHMSTGGLINGCRTATGANIPNCSLRGIAFGAGGVPHNFVYGTYVNPTGNMLAGDDPHGDYTQIYDGIKMVNPSDRISLFAHAGYELTDTVRMFAEAMYTESAIGPSFSVPPYRFGTSATTWLSVSAENAYLPDSIRARMSGPGGGDPTGPAFLNVGRMNDDWAGNSRIENTNTTQRFVIGFDGDLIRGWSWDAYYQYGQNEYFGTVANNLITSRGGVTALGNVNLAMDSVFAPAGNAAGIAPGTIVCRSTLTNPNNGCQPLNIFGVGSASQEAIDYIMGTQWTRQVYTQHVVEASAQGDLFSTWAGPISVATGVSFRTESIDAESDALSIESAFGIGNPKPYSGEYDVTEGFAEVVVPLADGSGVLGNADITLAGRATDYSTSGLVKTWKVGLSWSPIDDLRFRFTRSRDIRAPSLQELYTGATQARGSVIDHFKPGSATFNVQVIGGGNADLTPEIADTISGGVVYSPNWLPGFSSSVDYYSIEIRDSISTLGVQPIVDRCFAGNAALCNQIIRIDGDIIEIRSTNLNLAGFRTSGFDIEASYRTSLDTFVPSWSGDVGVRMLANYVSEFSTDDGVTSLDQAGSLTNQQPEWPVQPSYLYERGPLRATVTQRFVGSGVVSNIFTAPFEIDDNHVSSRLYTNLNLNYKFERFGGNAELFANVDNVFDVKPPYGFGWNYGMAASPQYDVIGRMFKVGLRLRY